MLGRAISRALRVAGPSSVSAAAAGCRRVPDSRGRGAWPSTTSTVGGRQCPNEAFGLGIESNSEYDGAMFWKASYAVLCGVVALAPFGGVVAADGVDRAVLDAFNAVVREVGSLAETDPDAAIEIYERALLDGPARGFGRLHLRIAHLHRLAGRSAEAAHHFEACLADERVDLIDRQFICERGLQQVTATLTIEGLPDGGRVMLIEPSAVAGPFVSGGRVPRGELLVVVEAPGRRPARSTIVVDGPVLWTARVGLEEPTRPIVSDEFVQPSPSPVEQAVGLPRWPAYAAGGLGALLIGSGVAIGVQNQDTLASIRQRQVDGRCGPDVCEGDLVSASTRATLADGMWIAGTTVVVASVAWWLMSGDAPVIRFGR